MKIFAVISLILPPSLLMAQSEAEQNRLFYEYNSQIANSDSTKTAVTKVEQGQVMEYVSRHPVATLLNPSIINHYDPSGAIGFCFGRAMAAHFAARKIGLDNQSIKKIFVIGDMRSGLKPEWRFHVTTIVKGIDGVWYAVDPILPNRKVVTAEQWLSWVRSVWDKPGKTNAYVTSADVVIPNLKKVPAAGEINNTEVMSTTFKPQTHEGVRKLKSAERFFDVSSSEGAAFQGEQFISTAESAAKRFNAAKIIINESAEYKYNRYFLDLSSDIAQTSTQDILKPNKIQTLMGAFRPKANRAELESLSNKAEESKWIKKRGGMRFDLIEANIDRNECFN